MDRYSHSHGSEGCQLQPRCHLQRRSRHIKVRLILPPLLLLSLSSSPSFYSIPLFISYRYLGVPSSGYGPQPQVGTAPPHPHPHSHTIDSYYPPFNPHAPAPAAFQPLIEEEEGGVSVKVGGGRRGARAVESKIKSLVLKDKEAAAARQAKVRITRG